MPQPCCVLLNNTFKGVHYLDIGLSAAVDYTHIYTYTPVMRYTHGAKKRTANLKKHGYDFKDASQVIEGPDKVTFEDKRFDYDEQRFITLGMLRGAVVVIATAETEEDIRVISMRKAEQNEEKIYYANLG